MRVQAIVGGLDVPVLAGLAPGVPATPALINARRVLLSQLHRDHRAGTADLLDTPGTFTAQSLRALLARAAKDPPERLWVVLSGEVVECLDEAYLTTSDAEPSEPGIPLDRLARLLRAVGAASLCVVLDVGRAREEGPLGDGADRWGPRQVFDALRELPCDLLAVGPGVAHRLGEALLGQPEARGPVEAGAVAARVERDGALARGAATCLNVATGVAAPTTEEGRRDTMVRQALVAVQERTAGVVPFDPDNRDGRVLLQDVYVRTEARAAGVASAKHRGGDKEQERTTLHDLVARHPCLVVIGEPGGGKTTFLRRLAHVAATATLDGASPVPGLPDRAVPVLAKLEDYGRQRRAADKDPSVPSLKAFVLGQLTADGSPLDPAVAEALWRERRLVVMLDGLDEVPEPDRRKRVAEAIAGLAAGSQGLRILVTCRPSALKAGVDVGRGFEHATIEPLDAERQAELVRRWMATRHGPEAAELEADKLFSQLRGNDRLAEELRSPLLMTMVCVLFWEDGRLPAGRSELYGRVVQLLLADRKKGAAFHWRKRVPDEWTRWRAAAEIAFNHRIGAAPGKADTATISLSRVREAVVAHEPDPVVADDLVDFLEVRSGLLAHVDADTGGQPLYTMPHRTLMEFLAAAHLAMRPTEDAVRFLVDRAPDADWREVTLLWVLRKTERPTDPVEPVAELIRRLVSGASAGEGAAARGRLAAECIAERRGVRELEDTAKYVDDTLQPVLTDSARSAVWPEAERVAFWLAIGKSDRRLTPGNRWVDIPGGWVWRGAVPGDKEPLPWEQPAREVWLSPYRVQRWPVLVDEYAAFVDAKAGGYAERRFWHEEGWEWLQQQEARAHPPGWHAQRSRPNVPVTYVSWWEARAFCAWASERLRDTWEIPQGWLARLPTEAESEAACRTRGPEQLADRAAVVKDLYPWGDSTPDDTRASYNDRTRLPAVGTYPRGASQGLGVLDLAGGVWEWCLDAWDETAYDANPPRDPVLLDPHQGPEDVRELAAGARATAAAEHRRVVRGGSFDGGPGGLRASFRSGWVPWVRYRNQGFRCVLSPPGRALAP